MVSSQLCDLSDTFQVQNIPTLGQAKSTSPTRPFETLKTTVTPLYQPRKRTKFQKTVRLQKPPLMNIAPLTYLKLWRDQNTLLRAKNPLLSRKKPSMRIEMRRCLLVKSAHP